jgi:hypothetical protein
VVSRTSRHTGTTMSKRGRTVTIVNHYESVFCLECGHCVVAPSSAPDAATKRCKKCEAA